MSSQNPTHLTEPGADPEADLLFELFEEALVLHSAGLAYESVLAKCPPPLRTQLHQQMDMATHLQATAPAMAHPRSQAQRSNNRAAFMRAAHSMGSHNVGNKATPTIKSPLDTISEALENLTRRLNDLVPQFSPRLSPILAMIALLLIGTVGVGSAYASALPGDVIYPVKEFVRDTEESFASEANKERVVQKNEDERRQDIEKAALERKQLIIATKQLRFYQKGDSIWRVGGLIVLPGYPSDAPNQPNTLLPIKLSGDPQPGDTVLLTYLIVPGKPNFVYGMELEVIPPTTPAIETSESVAPTPTPTLPPTFCEPTPPTGWIVYRVRRGDSMSALATKTGTAVATTKAINCFESDLLLTDSTLFLPAVVGVTLPDPNQPVTVPTPTEIPLITALPLATVTASTATEVASPTTENTATAQAATPTSAVTPTQAAQPTATEIAATPTATTEEATAVATPSQTSEGGVVVETPTETPTAENTATPTTAAESTASETPTVESATATPTAVAATPTPTTEGILTATPTAAAATTTPVAETPTVEPQPTATQAVEMTATTIPDTPIPDTPIPDTPISATPLPQATATPIPEQPTAPPAAPTSLPPATEVPQPTAVPTSTP